MSRNRRSWIRRAVRILQHDLTLAMLVIALLAVSVGVIAAARHDASFLAEYAIPLESGPASEPDAQAPELALTAADLLPPEPAAPTGPQLDVAEGELAPGDNLATALDRHGVSAATVHLIASELRGLFNFRRAQPGHRFYIARDEDGSLIEFQYFITDLDLYSVRRQGDGYIAAREEAEMRPRAARLAGVVTTSLHAAVVALGERGQLANDFSDIFAWDLDFSRSVQRGDEFSVLYERLYRVDEDGGETYVRLGRILAARYQGAAGDLSAVYFEPEEGRGGYYRPDGSSVQRQFLMAPLRYSRISSRYSAARRHPILKVTRPHHGIDYAAPRGSPLWSVADGKVIYRGWAGGFGNLVKVRHNNGYVSYYAHLSGFAKGLAVGQSVQQKQVVGYVGSTGLATGPHVCFRVARDGQYVDPTRIHTPVGPPVPTAKKHLFETARDVLFAELESRPLVEVEEAL